MERAYCGNRLSIACDSVKQLWKKSIVLLSWRDELRIALSPYSLALARITRRGTAKVIRKEILSCAATSTSDWTGAVAALHGALQDSSWAGSDARVIVSNHFVRYALVTWSEHLDSDDEKRAWVSHAFAERYGESQTPLEYRWSEEGPNGVCVASAMEHELLSQLRAAFESTSVRLVSLQPYLMAAFNRCKGKASRSHAWMLFPEPGRVCVAAVAQGAWRALRSKTIDMDWQRDLPLFLQRELLTSEDEEPAEILAYGADLENIDWGAVDQSVVKIVVPA